MQNVSKLSSSSLVVNLSLSVWTGRKLDKRVSEEVDQQKSTKTRAGNYTKNLFAGSGKLEELTKLSGAIRTASAKGLKWSAVVRGHALPNAAIPTITVLGFMVGSLLAGAVVVESVFAWPGVGRLLVVAVSNRDLAIVQVILLLVAGTMVAANFMVDLAYGIFDPRIKQAQRGGGK
jgi:ABC-type microcin C transport system permease subunit YejB